MIMQLTLTAVQAKWMIAKGVCRLPVVENAFANGRIILKGGTTVSAVSEELAGRPLMISGRVTPTGTMGSQIKVDTPGQPHDLFIERGENVSQILDWPQVMTQMRPGDCLITGANLFDVHGNAALMCGAQFGGKGIPHLHCAWSEGFDVIIAVGLEKLIPGRVADAVRSAGRRRPHKSYGMAVGLIPLVGEIFTEVEAIKSLAEVDCQVIGRGGVQGAEGGTTVVVEGDEDQISIIEKIFLEIYARPLSGTKESLMSCVPGCVSCKKHVGCVYKRGSKTA